jgi:hypothetical protein
MDVDIHSAIFNPLDEGDPYFVVVSALPLDQRLRPRKGAQKSITTTTLEEARSQCRALAYELRDLISVCGDNVRAIHLK